MGRKGQARSTATSIALFTVELVCAEHDADELISALPQLQLQRKRL